MICSCYFKASEAGLANAYRFTGAQDDMRFAALESKTKRDTVS